MQPQNTPGVRWEWISEAWNLFTRQWSVWVLMLLVMFLVVLAAYLPFFGLGMMASFSEDGGSSIFGTLAVLYSLVFAVIIICAMPWMTGGLYNAAFKQIRGEQIAVKDLFSGGKYFVRILGAGLLIGIAAGIGSIVLVGGLIVAGLTFLAIPMIVEGGKGVIDAIKESFEITKRDWIMFTLFSLAVSFIAGAGAIACGIGILATAPLAFLAHALAYRDCVGMPGAERQGQLTAPPPPPDYRDYAPAQASAQPEYRSYTPPAPAPAPQAPAPQSPPPQAPPWSAQTFVTPPPQPPPPEAATTTCPHCGATLARVMNFCNQCGRPLRNA